MQISRIRLVWGCFCQGERVRNFCCLSVFVRPAPRALRPDRVFPIGVARSGSRGRRFFSTAEGRVLDGREHGGRLLAIGWLARAMIRGEPAIGRDQSREPRLYSVEPVWVQTMKQSYASAGKAPRRRVHSLSGIAAIAGCGLPPPRIVIGYPAHQAQSGAEPCLSFLVL
jgi:hypothetical protein